MVAGWTVAAAGGATAMFITTLPALPAEAAVHTPPVISTTTPGPEPSASSSPSPSSPGAVGVHGAPTPRVVLVTAGLSPSTGVLPPRPTGLPTPSSSASGSVSPTSSPSESGSRAPSSSTTPAAVSLAVKAAVTPAPSVGASIGLLGATVSVGLRLP